MNLALLKKTFVAASLTALLSAPTFAAGAKLVQLLSSKSGIEEVLYKKGVIESDLGEIQANMVKVLSEFSSKDGELPSQSQLLKQLDAISNPADRKVVQELKAILNKDLDSVTNTEVEEAYTKLVHLADSYGRNAFKTMQCNTCVTDSMSKNGFEKKLTQTTNTNVLKAKEVIESRYQTDRKLQSYVKKALRKQNFGSFKAGELDASELKSLAIFLKLNEGKIGTKAQKTLISSIADLSKDSKGRTQLVSDHTFWNIFVEENIDDAAALRWSELFNRIAINKKQGNLSTEEAFFKTLDDDINDSAIPADKRARMKANRDDIKARGCFFKK